MSASRLSLAALAAFVLLSIHACSRENGPTLSAPDAYARAQAGTLTLIDIRHAGKCWCIDPSDEATDVVSRAIGALAAAHADIGTALTDQLAH